MHSLFELEYRDEVIQYMYEMEVSVLTVVLNLLLPFLLRSTCSFPSVIQLHDSWLFSHLPITPPVRQTLGLACSTRVLFGGTRPRA